MDEIEAVPTVLHDEAIRDIEGLNVFDAQTFEKGVMEKLDKDIKEKEERKTKKKTEKIFQEIRTIKSLMRQNEKARSILEDSHTMAHVEKMKVLKTQYAKYERQLRSCESRLGEVTRVQRLQQLTEDGDDVEIDPVLGIPQTSMAFDKTKVSAAKTLKQRAALIKQGLATPFSFTPHPSSTQLFQQPTRPPSTQLFQQPSQPPSAKKPAIRLDNSNENPFFTS
uniref:Uncharacterized protein n=1 Tax=Ciona savignyi TaxID=51511 RepID=H2Y670_CIOSA